MESSQCAEVLKAKPIIYPDIETIKLSKSKDKIYVNSSTM